MSTHDWNEVRIGLYDELDRRIGPSTWDGTVSEAHGLLTGLACLGVTSAQVTGKLYLLQGLGHEETELLEAMFGLIVQDLESDTPAFNLLLPKDEETLGLRLEELSNWCSGFMLGYCHGNGAMPDDQGETVSEALQDIMQISAMQEAEAGAGTDEEALDQERQLVEIEEYLRISIQLIYEESVTPATHVNPADTTYH